MPGGIEYKNFEPNAVHLLLLSPILILWEPESNLLASVPGIITRVITKKTT
jgi:hypothetical protein